MGPGNRIEFGFFPGFGVMFGFARFPYALTITITLPGFWISIGLGPSYLDDEEKARIRERFSS